jgi:hypothetical protein
MEARISSIEGSWTFADWLIPAFPTELSHPPIALAGAGTSESSLASLLYASGMGV